MNNKLFFDYGPVWSKKCHDDEYLASRNVPPPDSITCGQMITQNFFSHNETEDYSVNDSAKLEEPEVKTRKYTSKKFPLNFDTSATPFLNQPDYEQQLHGNRNKRYLNLLSSYELNNVNHLVYSEYDGESNVLKISSLNELDESKGEVVLSSTQFISEFNVLHQVQADVINNIPYILLIVDDTVSFLRVSEEGFNLCCVETKDITSSCLNKDLSNCFAFTKEATINLFDVEKEKVMWCCPLNNASYKTKKFTQCEFGNNPFNICVSCESQITLADTRTAENHKKRNLFEIDKFSTYLYSDKEIISSCKHTQDSPLFYVACSNTLLLMDERYCKYPVLNWYHMIKGRPSHIQCFKRNDIDFVVMAEPNKSQFCFTSLQWDNSEYPEVHSLSTPIHKNIVKDTILFAKKHEIALSDLTEKQICSPLVGLSIFPFSFGHTVVFQNNYGNLFYFNCYDRKSKRNFISKETAIQKFKNV
ncbi:hypothetical protein Avbf_06508 [Armadillidium vulgare]|nr:hypothetical protein Avbf_06508 [Armadillidium vulgare]